MDLEEAARRTMILDVNSRYFGLETLVLMENAGRGVEGLTVLRWSEIQVFIRQSNPYLTHFLLLMFPSVLL